MSALTLLAISPPPAVHAGPDTRIPGVIWIEFPSGGQAFPPVIQDVVEVSVNSIRKVWAGFNINTYIQQYQPSSHGLTVQFKPEVVADIFTIPAQDFTKNINYEAPANSTVFATYYRYTQEQNGAITMQIPAGNYVMSSAAESRKWHRQRRDIPSPNYVVHHYHHTVD